ncbi:Carbonic anhydrase 2 [Hypsizygus marmoreus]|uniref:Carbonic anhydrase n=1 Tax=Hypsizygus marmoreus TaxID=39966 RepID=A0A369K7C2_HYPMA|nr:Carbonic anhydrase 2 [Hypsizygus marmoreus]
MPADDIQLQEILASNAAWAADVLKGNPQFFAATEAQYQQQRPHTLWIGCADSRVSEAAVIPDVNPGEIFVHRNIANQLHLDDNNALSVLQYAVDELKVRRVIIVGHTRCGGVAAALGEARSRAAPLSASSPPAGKLALSQWLEPFTQTVVGLLPQLAGLSEAEAVQRLVDVNVKEQVAQLARTQTISNAWAKYATEDRAAVWIHGFVYDLDTGLLRDLHISQGPPGSELPK